MKRIYPLLITLILFLSACHLLPPEESLYNGELEATHPPMDNLTHKSDVLTPEPEPVGAPQEGKILETEEPMEVPDSVSFGDKRKSEPEDLSNAPRPEVNWQPDPGALIVSGKFCCGYTTPLVPINYLPDVQIWGDGHIVWVERGDDGSRRVLEAWLSPQEMAQSLQQVVEAGFFGMQNSYRNPLVADFADKCLEVNLAGFEKKVCEYYQGAPPAFHDLYGFFASGTGVEGVDYIPNAGYLVSYPLQLESSQIPDEVDLVWDSHAMGVSLADAVDRGLWVEDDALTVAWKAVNSNPWGMVVQEGDRYYQISLQIPGISWQEPPVR